MLLHVLDDLQLLVVAGVLCVGSGSATIHVCYLLVAILTEVDQLRLEFWNFLL